MDDAELEPNFTYMTCRTEDIGL